MTRIQIHLPEDLYRRAKSFAAVRDLSLAEIMRRGLELFLERHPKTPPSADRWTLPKVNGRGLKVPLAQLRRLTADDETGRSRRP